MDLTDSLRSSECKHDLEKPEGQKTNQRGTIGGQLGENEMFIVNLHGSDPELNPVIRRSDLDDTDRSSTNRLERLEQYGVSKAAVEVKDLLRIMDTYLGPMSGLDNGQSGNKVNDLHRRAATVVRGGRIASEGQSDVALCTTRANRPFHDDTAVIDHKHHLHEFNLIGQDEWAKPNGNCGFGGALYSRELSFTGQCPPVQVHTMMGVDERVRPPVVMAKSAEILNVINRTPLKSLSEGARYVSSMPPRANGYRKVFTLLEDDLARNYVPAEMNASRYTNPSHTQYSHLSYKSTVNQMTGGGHRTCKSAPALRRNYSSEPTLIGLYDDNLLSGTRTSPSATFEFASDTRHETRSTRRSSSWNHTITDSTLSTDY